MFVRLTKYLEDFIKILACATFFVPLIVLPSSFIFPFIVPKVIIFRSLVELMLAAYILLLISNWDKYRPRFNIVNIAVVLFFFSFAISTFSGLDTYHSFWDNHERMLGLLTIFHYVSYCLICGAIFKEWKDWRRALLVFLGAGSVVMFIGLLQVFNPNLLLNQGNARVASTLGNPIYVSGYGMFLFFVAALLFLKEKVQVWKYLEATAGILAIMGLFLGGSRGPLLGWVVGVTAAVFAYLFLLKEEKYKKLKLVLWSIVGLIILVSSVFYIFRQTQFVQDIPGVNRVFSTTLSSVENSPRWIAWGIAIKAWKAHPFFGWGPNNYFYAFNQYYNPKLLDFGYGETWFDNAHNIIMNTLAVQGTFGILVYLSIFILSWVFLIDLYKKGKIDKHVLVVGSAFLLAHIIKNVTVFEDPTSYLYFMFWLAFVSALDKEPKGKQLNPDKQIGIGSLVVSGFFALIFIFVLNVQPARANTSTLQALKMINADPIAYLGQAKTVLSFSSPHIDDIRSDISRTLSQVLSGNNNKLTKEQMDQVYDVIIPELKKNLDLHPYDIRNQLILSQLSQMRAINDKNINYLVDAETYLTDALSKSPERQQLIYSLSSIELSMGKTQQAYDLLSQALKSNPKIGESYWRLAYTYQITGQKQKALDVLNLSVQNGVVFSDQEKQIIAQIMGMINSPASTSTLKKK